MTTTSADKSHLLTANPLANGGHRALARMASGVWRRILTSRVVGSRHQRRMGDRTFQVIVVGQGAAGLAAALAAAETARSRKLEVGITLIDKAPAEQAG